MHRYIHNLPQHVNTVKNNCLRISCAVVLLSLQQVEGNKNGFICEADRRGGNYRIGIVFLPVKKALTTLTGIFISELCSISSGIKEVGVVLQP